MRPVVLLFLVFTVALPAQAAPGGKAKPAAAAAAAPKAKLLAAPVLDKLREQLQGDDDAAALRAAKELGDSGAPNAVEPLVATLAAGTTPARGQAALDGLAKLGGPGKSVDVLELYAGHRNNELRVRAVKGLVASNDKRVTAVLMDRLGDASAEVRAAAAEGLAARREKPAAARLLLLVKRNDAGAAGPLGALASPDLIPQVAELQGGVDDGVLATALGEFIKRDDVADKLRVEVVRTIGKLAGAAATTALIEYIAVVPTKDDRPSKREAQKIIDERGSAK